MKNFKRLGFMKFSFECSICNKEQLIETSDGNLDKHAKDIIERRFRFLNKESSEYDCLCTDCKDKIDKTKYKTDYFIDFPGSYFCDY